ncbi:hypothetical protein [Nostoc sp.]|uniref:hypothetical protein n=1 Tax=Nostoc sp. TaxID=1180 RepID=UPI002FF97FB6
MLFTRVASVAIRYLFPKVSQSREIDLESLCWLYPKNSRCQNYLPGSVALAKDGKEIEVHALLATAKPEILIFISLPDF